MAVTVRLTASIRYDPRERQVVVGGAAHRLSERQAAILDRLIAEENELVRRETLIDDIWDGNYLVGSQGLTREIHGLRQLLDDDARSPTIIITVPRKGYRLGAPPLRAPPWRRRLMVMTAILIAALLLAFSRPPQVTAESTMPIALLARELVAGTGQEEAQPSVSADGSVISYSAFDPSSGRWSIVVREHGREHRIRADGNLRSPRLSPDGRHLLYASDEGQACGLMVVAVDQPDRPRMLSRCQSARLTNWDWLGDEGIVVAFRAPQEWRLALMRSDQAPQPLLSWPHEVFKPRSSPDGSRVAFLDNDGQGIQPHSVGQDGEVMSWDLDGRSATALAWLDDQRLVVAAHAGVSTGGDLLVLHPDGSVTLLESPGVMTINLDYAIEAGTLLVEETGLDIDIHVIDAAGDRRLAGQAGAWDMEPSISPDGKQLVYVSVGSSGSQLMLENLEDGSNTTLYHGPGTLRLPQWEGDAAVTVVTQVDDDQRLMRFDLIEGTATEIEAARGADLAFQLEDGRLLTLQRDPGSFTVTVAVAGEPGDLLQDVFLLEPAADGLFYSTFRGDLYHWRDGHSQRLPHDVRARRWSFDGDQLLTLAQIGGDEWSLLGRDAGSLTLPSVAPKAPAAPDFDVHDGLVAVEFPQRRWRNLVRLEYDLPISKSPKINELAALNIFE